MRRHLLEILAFVARQTVPTTDAQYSRFMHHPFSLLQHRLIYNVLFFRLSNGYFQEQGHRYNQVINEYVRILPMVSARLWYTVHGTQGVRRSQLSTEDPKSRGKQMYGEQDPLKPPRMHDNNVENGPYYVYHHMYVTHREDFHCCTATCRPACVLSLSHVWVGSWIYECAVRISQLTSQNIGTDLHQFVRYGMK